MSHHHLAGPPHRWEMRRTWQIDFLITQGLERYHRLIDVGCGPLCGGVPIAQYLHPGNYTGIDIRQEAIDAAHEEARRYGLVVDLIHPPALLGCGAAAADVIWLCDTMIHMVGPALWDCLAFVEDALRDGGKALATVNYGTRKDGSWRGFPTAFRSFAWYHDLCVEHGLSCVDLGTVEDHGYQIERPRKDHTKHILEIRHA